jgi:hypothetical protein
LRKFPGYTTESLLDEYASRFYVLLEQSYKLDAEERLEDIQVTMTPQDHQYYRSVVKSYEDRLDKEDEPVRTTSQLKGSTFILNDKK